MKIVRWGVGTAVALTVAVGVVLAPSAFAHDDKGLQAIGLTKDGRSLVKFTTADPGKAEKIGDVQCPAPAPHTAGGAPGLNDMLPDGGLPASHVEPKPEHKAEPKPSSCTLVGIDYRVQNGKLYGLGSDGTIYTIDEKTAKATPVGKLSIALQGKFFGVDFNPAANALRVISDTGQNLRQPFAGGTGDGPNPNTATIADGTLNYGGTTATGVSAAGYTNNDLDGTGVPGPMGEPAVGTATQLFDIDTKKDQLALQNPPNAGTLTGIGPLPKIGPNAGFDIFSTLKNGSTVDNDAFAVVEKDGTWKLLAVSLADGSSADRGTFKKDVVDLAIKLDQS